MNPLNQAYQLFVDEVPELLQEIENGLLNLREHKSTSTVNAMIRSVRSIKVYSASVGLQEIKNIAHRLEDYLKALYNEDLVIDTELEDLFLAGYDSLAIPLGQQLETGNFHRQQAQNRADEVWEKLELKLGNALEQVENYFPSSEDLDVDMVASIFEVDIAQEILRLKGLAASPESFNPSQELQESLDILTGLAEFVNLPGFSLLINITQQALQNHSDKAVTIASLLVRDLEKSQESVLQGENRDTLHGQTEGGSPCSALLTLAQDTSAEIEVNAIKQLTKNYVATLNVEDPSYQFFIAEVPDLLHNLESGLLTVKEDKSISKVNDMMRFAHSLKGGAASVGLEGIKNIAHKLEDYLKALFDDSVIVDDELETYLLEGLDCLKNALSEQIETGNYPPEWEEKALVIWDKLGQKLGHIQVNDYLPSSADLGIDLVQSLFEVDVLQTIEHLQESLNNLPIIELQTDVALQLEILVGFSEMTNLVGLKNIADTVSLAITNYPHRIQQITTYLIDDLIEAREQVLSGQRDQGGQPSSKLQELAGLLGVDDFQESTLDFGELLQEYKNQEIINSETPLEEQFNDSENSHDLRNNPSENALQWAENIEFADLIGQYDSFSTLTPDTAPLPPNSGENQGDLKDFASLASDSETNQGENPPNLRDLGSISSEFAKSGDLDSFMDNFTLEEEDTEAESESPSNQQQELQAQVYLFFLEEAVDLIAIIDDGLENALATRDINEVNEIARAAHSLKGGARSAGLEDLGNIALKVEKSLKALFNQNIPLDDDTKAYIRQIYQLLRQPLIARLEDQSFDEKFALESANELWAEFEGKYGEEIAKSEEFLPSSRDLGIDIATSIFEVDVVEGINTLKSALNRGNEAELQDLVSMQIEVFSGFGEMLALPGFVAICETAAKALKNNNPSQITAITQAFIDNLEIAQQQVMETDPSTPLREGDSGGKPSKELLALAGETITENPAHTYVIEHIEESIDTSDQSYSFFVEEAPELLEIIENGLLTIRQERSTAKIHEIMRAAHSLKGGSASVGLEAIKTISHQLEDVFKVLYNPDIELDTELEGWLLEAFDCLRNALTQQMETGSYNPEEALITANEIWARIYGKLGPALSRVDDYIPSSLDLGVDIVQSIFEVDVQEELQRLKDVLKNPHSQPLAGELRATLEVFSGFGEMLALPGFAEIARLGLTAIDINPTHAAKIIEIIIRDAGNARDLVLKGERTTGGQSSRELRRFAENYIKDDEEEENYLLDTEQEEQEEREDNNFEDRPSLTDVFGALQSATEEIFTMVPEDGETKTNNPSLEEVFNFNVNDDDQIEAIHQAIQEDEEDENIPSLEDIFASEFSGEEIELLAKASELALEEDKNQTIPSVSEIFSNMDTSVIDARGEEQENIVSPSLSEIFSNVDIPVIDQVGEQEEKEGTESTPSLESVFELESLPLNGDMEEVAPSLGDLLSVQNQISSVTTFLEEEEQINALENIDEVIKSIGDVFPKLPGLKTSEEIGGSFKNKGQKVSEKPQPEVKLTSAPTKSNLTVRVDLERLERMNNLIGELSINRNGLSLQNDKLQTSVKELLERFMRFQQMANNLRDLSDKMVASPDKFRTRNGKKNQFSSLPFSMGEEGEFNLASAFDSLEMDSYDNMYYVVQGLIEQMIQLEEAVDDIALFAGQSGQTVENQRQMLNRLRDELMWARMLPLGEVLNRFPRVLRDLSVKYHKKVNLKLSGTNVLVDKAALEKLYDPLVHLIRNGFDHGIETPEIRKQRGKPETGIIEVKAYHQGNQTIIEIKDDGGGLNLHRIGQKAVERQLLTPEQLAVTTKENLFNLIFEPGFSTAAAVTEISGRGVGLDIVRSQLRSLKGTISVDSEPGLGTTFILRLPLTLTIDKLLVLSAENHFYALPSDNIEEIIVPEEHQLKTSANKRFLHYENKVIPIYSMTDLLKYRCYLSNNRVTSLALEVLPTPEEWGNPLLLMRLGQELFAIEVDNLVSEQELVIKPFGSALTAPSYTYGCTILGDGTLIPVINTVTLLANFLEASQPKTTLRPRGFSGINVDKTDNKPVNAFQAASVLVVDDSAAMRRTLALSLEKSGYRVLQAKDGKEAIEQLQQSSNVSLIICDIEMPNMNGFEFLGQRRRYPELNKIPVAMLTSRSNDKHRKLATHLGANAYFTKPYIEQKFLQSIRALIEQKSPVTL